jgi:hypothetical protein
MGFRRRAFVPLFDSLSLRIVPSGGAMDVGDASGGDPGDTMTNLPDSGVAGSYDDSGDSSGGDAASIDAALGALAGDSTDDGSVDDPMASQLSSGPEWTVATPVSPLDPYF